MRSQNNLKAEHNSPITENCCIPNKLLDVICSKILLDIGASE